MVGLQHRLQNRDGASRHNVEARYSSQIHRPNTHRPTEERRMQMCVGCKNYYLRDQVECMRKILQRASTTVAVNGNKVKDKQKMQLNRSGKILKSISTLTVNFNLQTAVAMSPLYLHAQGPHLVAINSNSRFLTFQGVYLLVCEGKSFLQ